MMILVQCCCFVWVLLVLFVFGLVIVLVVMVFECNIVYLYIFLEVLCGDVDVQLCFCLGGMVVKGFFNCLVGLLEVCFEVIDGDVQLVVIILWILLDMFVEGIVVVVSGCLQDGVFVVDEVLVKYDEKYVLKEVVDKMGDVYCKYDVLVMVFEVC